MFLLETGRLFKELIHKNVLKTDLRFELPDPDYSSVNPYKKKIFVKKVIFCVKS
jgi:hypothetical protein